MMKLVENTNKILKQNGELIKRVEKLEETSTIKKDKKTQIIVPNAVRAYIHLAYKEGCKIDRHQPWKIDNDMNHLSEVNKPLSTYMKDFACGLNKELENKELVINSAIATYFETKKSSHRKRQNNPNYKKDQAKSQRKIHKANRRKKALNASTKIKTPEKSNFIKAIVQEMMSSEEEKEDNDGRYYEVKSPPWRTKDYKKIVKHADRLYNKNISERSKEQQVRRKKGTPSKRRPPKKLDYGFDIFIDNETTP